MSSFRKKSDILHEIDLLYIKTISRRTFIFFFLSCAWVHKQVKNIILLVLFYLRGKNLLFCTGRYYSNIGKSTCSFFFLWQCIYYILYTPWPFRCNFMIRNLSYLFMKYHVPVHYMYTFTEPCSDNCTVRPAIRCSY